MVMCEFVMVEQMTRNTVKRYDRLLNEFDGIASTQ